MYDLKLINREAKGVVRKVNAIAMSDRSMEVYSYIPVTMEFINTHTAVTSLYALYDVAPTCDQDATSQSKRISRSKDLYLKNLLK